MGATFVVNPTLAPTTSTNVSTVDVSVVNVTILAANESRLGATIYNSSTANLYLLLGTSAASTDIYTVILVPGAYYETPYNYIGQINGIWDAASTTGAAQCTELI